MDVAKIFEMMPSQFNADKAGDMDSTIYFDLSGDNGGQYYAAIANGECTTSKGTPDNPTATIKMDGNDYADMIQGNLNPMAAFMSGKIKVEGDLGTVMKMQSVFGF